MLRRIWSLLLVLCLMLTLFPSADAYPHQDIHDKKMKDILFGDGYILTGSAKTKYQNIADAAALCIDQFSANETIRSKSSLFNHLKREIGFSLSFEDIELQKGIDGKNVTPDTHRKYTHNGWNFTEYPLKKLWIQRKKILTATVNKELFGESPGILTRIPFAEGLIYSEEACNEQCEAFCKLVYYIHILGDYDEAKSYSSEFQQLIPLVRHEDPNTPALIDELISLIPGLFPDQRHTYPLLIQELEKTKKTAESILFVTGGIKTQEQFDAYHQCANEIVDTLKGFIPGMLRKTDFFADAFYR